MLGNHFTILNNSMKEKNHEKLFSPHTIITQGNQIHDEKKSLFLE